MRAPLVAALLLLAPALAAPALVAPAHATPDDLRSLAGMKTHNRVLLVFAPSLRDPRIEAQRGIMARFSLGAAERDLLLVQVGEDKVIGAHDTPDRLRRTFKTPPQRYRTLLLGKDGSIAIDAAGPVDERHLAQAIDAMPMRREEIRKAQAGHPLPKSN